MILKAFLNSRSIKQMADDLRGFEEGFKENIRAFRELLAEKGIRVAMSNVNSTFGQYMPPKKALPMTTRPNKAFSLTA